MSRALDRLPSLLEDDEAAVHDFESLRWPADRPACFHCGGFGHMRPLAGSRRIRVGAIARAGITGRIERTPFSQWRHAARLRRAAAKATACRSPRDVGADRIRLLVELSLAI